MSFCIKSEQSYISKLHSIIFDDANLMSSFKESTERQKSSFLKETVENADLHKAVLKKTIATQKSA